MLAYIWAEDEQHHIGIDGHLPWSLPADLAYFKVVTKNHPIVMGRRTFDSFPGFLPKRHHYVLTRSAVFGDKYKDDSRITVVNNIENLKKILKQEDSDVFIIGGASLFAEFADTVDLLYVTRIKGKFPGDTTMPELQMDDFELIKKVSGTVDERNKFPHVFEVYQRKA
ncbi:dihydrofolate reductase [Liquorilactobacillus mali]|uniref:Dihydrofolate reductase n=1 Tax=Liquorilactobacillus mali KCTC 3596 = DSM 20444 TaxID=1046596 RepID=J0KXP3_9LACO|nr:dihydrofolate reductase [Liquorilactobacillus mali]EJE98444.1 Dihydrofolate reductase [Liquorilactobacillus mali KCTC 3596 = DSM 20444]KRN08580.1 dihydrofolate reductase [Liquorilactobacillus mali KCTC 3596 = DSM 20444]MDC7952174.1 dihydrofolate reductase [Liquorilactobacillus mali]QFQ74737.1 dihydrofolate reductase [Liquorilactobacillus mali]